MKLINKDTTVLGEAILKYKPIQKFLHGIGDAISTYLGRDKACVIGLEDDGVFYAEGLYWWLKKKGNDVTFATMDDTCRGLEGDKVFGRKVLIVDNYIITGTGYRKVVDKLRARKEDLGFKDIKFAVLCDRKNLADFSVEGYTVSESDEEECVKLDRIDFAIMQILMKDGRKSCADIAKETNLTSAGIQKRMNKLMKGRVLEVKGLLNVEKFYTMSASIDIEADSETCERLTKKLKTFPFVYALTKVYASYNLSVEIVAPNLKKINDFVDKEIRSESGVRHVVVHVGELPILPRFLNSKVTLTD